MKHKCVHVVRGYECDGYNHVNNAVYLNYLEYARMEFLGAVGFDYKRLRQLGYGVVVSRISINYRLPAGLGDKLEIETVPVKRRITSGMFHQSITRNGELVCDAEVTWVFIGIEGRPTRLPGEFDRPELDPDLG